MKLTRSLFILLFIPCLLDAQQSSLARFTGDSVVRHANLSFCVKEIETKQDIVNFNKEKSLSQASVMKLVTTAVALEKLGPDYRFTTRLGYTGSIRGGTLHGNIIIKGGGDPCLASPDFEVAYGDLFRSWVEAIKGAGIKKISGNIITDDSYYDYQPVPANWNWEDMGNYYGAGVHGLSIFDNTCELHFVTEEVGTVPILRETKPAIPGLKFNNRLTAGGTSDEGYVFLAPYTFNGWIEGTIPPGKDDFVLKSSIPDPPLLASGLLAGKLKEAGVAVSGISSTVRLGVNVSTDNLVILNETLSPRLAEIIDVLNHKSVNLYAEHLVKELGKAFKGVGTTSAGLEVIHDHLDSLGLWNDGIFMLDGSGLSPQDALSSESLTDLLIYMKKGSASSETFYSSLPEAGKNGTLKSYFRDKVFESNLRAKSGSLTRVRSYAGYFKTASGREMAFAVIINNYNGTSRYVISGIEEILKEIIVNN
ncbi:MAG: D-alanyl-D-alanine carboxypeptidase/D-alanyl-D-alanine-endopeptidase [Bacteroidales bacterium]